MTTNEFIQFCIHQHDVECNQKYDKTKPYSFHLNYVFETAKEYFYLLSMKDSHTITAGIYGHDLIEDARISYNDIKDLIGYEVAEIIFLCTENKGRNRLARKSVEFYKDLAFNRLAVFVKLCDIQSNSEYSLTSKSSMFGKYKAEWPKVREILYTEEFKDIFENIDLLYKQEI